MAFMDPNFNCTWLTEGIFFVSKNNNENEKIIEKADLDNYLSEVTNDVEVEEELEHSSKYFTMRWVFQVTLGLHDT